MNHGRNQRKLSRTSSHRKALLRNMVTSLLEHEAIRTTDAKAKELRGVAEKMITLGKRGTLHARRLATAKLHTHGPTVALSKAERQKWRLQEDVIRILFEDIAPAFKGRTGGYTRIIKLEQRPGDAANKAILEWVDEVVTAAPVESPADGDKKKLESK